MRKLLFLFFLLIIPAVAGETYRQFSNIDFTEVVRLNGAPYDTALANITIKDPDNILLIGFEAMTYDSTDKTFNYTLTSDKVTKTGTYSRCITAFASGLNTTECFYFDVTPSGKEQTSILENPFIILFGLMGLALLLFGIWASNPWLGFISSIMFLLGGIYTFIYGFNNEQNLYSQATSISFIGLGVIFMFLSAYEFISKDKEDD